MALGHKLCNKPHGKVMITILHFFLWALLGSYDVHYQSVSVLLSFPQRNKSLIIAAFLCIRHGALFHSVDMPSALLFSSVSAQCLGSWSASIKTSRTFLHPLLCSTLVNVTQQISMGSLCVIAKGTSLCDLFIDDNW